MIKNINYMALVLVSIMSLAVLIPASYAGNVANNGKTQSLSSLRAVFDNYGCSGCHAYMYKNSTSGPAVVAIAALAKFKTRKWVISWVMDPKKHYKEPGVKALIDEYNEYMPNNGVNRADAGKLYQYLMRIASKSSKKKK